MDIASMDINNRSFVVSAIPTSWVHALFTTVYAHKYTCKDPNQLMEDCNLDAIIQLCQTLYIFTCTCISVEL